MANLMHAIPLEGLRAFVVLCLGPGGALLLALTAAENLAFLRVKLREHHGELNREVQFLRLKVSARQIVWAQVACLSLSLLAMLLRNPLLASLASLPAFCVGPVLSTRRARRTTDIEGQLDGWMTGLASVLRATPALGDAIEYSLGLVGSPLSEELETLVKEQKLGTPLDEALVRMAGRIRSRTLQTALGTLRIGQRTGGDISKILERSANTLREMARLEGVVRVKTAEGKAQGVVLVLLPFPMVALFHYINPSFLLPLVEYRRGHFVIAGAVLCWIAAVFLTRRILRVDI